MGLGGAAVMPQTLSIIATVFEPRERARAIGIWTSAVGIGVALGPALGGLVVLGLFAWWETRIDHPSLDVRLFKNRSLSASVGSIALLFFGMGGVYFFTAKD